jgi:hypothetical protein
MLAVVGLGCAIGGGLVVYTVFQDRAHQEQMAPRHLEAFVRHQNAYREQDLDGDGVFQYADDLEALNLGYMADEYNGYRYEVRVGAQPEFEWSGEAVPTQSRGPLTYRAHYYVDQTGIVRVELDRPATAESPVYQAETP